MTTVRFWRPEHNGSPDELALVGCIASGRCLYLVLEGPGQPPPRDKSDLDTIEAFWFEVKTASGVALQARGMGGNRGNREKGQPQQLFAEVERPPNPTDGLTVTLLREDGSAIWEVQAVPVFAD